MTPETRPPAWRPAVRVGLPLAIAVAGLVLIVAGDGLGGALLGVAFFVVLANLWIRLALSSERDREREERARSEFTRTGRWPS